MSRSPLRSFLALSFMIGVPALVLGCPKKKEPVAEVDAGPPPTPVVTNTPPPQELVPLDTTPDAGEDAGQDAGAK
jgi:hypothetical protein